MMSKNDYIKEWRKRNPEKVKAARRRYRGKSPEKIAATLSKWRATNQDKILASELKQYALTVEQYRAMVKTQEGLCAICNKSPGNKYRLSVDHCHQTGQVRGLLCHGCNRLLGVYEANKIRFEDYLGRYRNV